MFLSDRCSSPALMYSSLLLTTMVEPLSALLMTRLWLEESCVRASLSPLVRLCLTVCVSVMFAISFLMARKASSSGLGPRFCVFVLFTILLFFRVRGGSSFGLGVLGGLISLFSFLFVLLVKMLKSLRISLAGAFFAVGTNESPLFNNNIWFLVRVVSDKLTMLSLAHVRQCGFRQFSVVCSFLYLILCLCDLTVLVILLIFELFSVLTGGGVWAGISAGTSSWTSVR